MKKLLLPLAAWLLAAPLFAATAAKPLWTQPLGADAKWYQLTAAGTLLVGTPDALLSVSPDDGKVLWRRADIAKSTRNNAVEIAGTPWIVANNFAGLGNSKVTFQALDLLTGETVWKTPQLSGQYLDTLAVPAQGLVIFVVQTWEEKDNGIYLRAHDLATGALKWATKFCKSNGIPLHLADGSGKFMPTMDLSGYHDPVIDGDEMFLGYLGIHCVDLHTGAIKWGVEFPPGAKGLKKTYAPLRLDGDRLYGAGGGSVCAIDRRTGRQLWKSERISEYAGLFKARDNAIVSQLEIVDGKIFARFGGNFSDGNQVQLREPLGVVVLDAATGNPVYKDQKIEGGLTNLLVLPEAHAVMFADGKELVGLSTTGATVTESFRVPIEFKRKLGGGDVAKIGLGLTGGLMGTIKAVSSTNKARLDVPVAITRQNGHIVVQGKQHLLGFDPLARQQKWSLYYAAPSDAFATLAMFAVTALASAQGNMQVAQNGGIMNRGGQQGMNNIQSALDRYNAYTEKRAAQAGGSKATEAYTYIVTKLPKSGLGLYGVNLATGATDRELPLGAKDPDYLADERTGRIYYFKGHDTLVAYAF
ncbi:PQQ-binding-like beta-propeller repeat protein [Oleiharenicola sp. Vm1]|uniref:outer membrane protein assembly factor BamB family protein n=1 Tax=Oleiharenicola sp. Vm1 TaxID=3398393 RepID=UPI0039F5ABE2